MERKITVNKTNSYTSIQDFFLAHWIKVIGSGPGMLYLQILSYCHQGKDIAWPSIQTLNKRMGTTTKTLIKYRNTLVEYGLIKKIIKRKTSLGGYEHNVYQIILLDKEKVLLPPEERYPEETEEIVSGIAEASPSQPINRPEKIKVDERTLKKEHIMKILKKLKLDKNRIAQIILNYSLEDIEGKLDLLAVKRNVINPAGWLIAALQGNYLHSEHDNNENVVINSQEEKESEAENKTVKSNKKSFKEKPKGDTKRLSRKEELEWIKQIRNQISK